MTSAGGSDAEALDEEHNEGSLLLGGGPRHRRARAGTSGGRTGGGDDGGGGEKSGGLDAAYAVIGECGLAQVPAYVLPSLAWVAAGPMTLLSIYVTAMGSWVDEAGEVHDDSSPPCDGTPFSWVEKGFSAVTEYDLACGGREKYVTLLNMSFWIGFLCTTNLWGVLADRCGRRGVLMVVTGAASVATLLTSTARSLLEVILWMGVTGAFSSGIGLCSLLLAVESVGSKYRGYAGIGQQVFWSIGVLTSSFAAWDVQPNHGWRRYAALYAATPGVMFVVVAVIGLMESPRWMMMNGHVDEAAALLSRMGRRNGKEDEGLDVKLRAMLAQAGGGGGHGVAATETDVPVDQTPKENLRTVFSHTRLRKLLLQNCYLWFAVSTMYYGLNFLLSDIQGNFYLNAILFSLVELMGVVLAMLVVEKIGRRGVLLVCLVSSSLCLLVSGLSDSRALQRSAAVTGKAGISAVFALLYLFSSEMQPTTVRSQCLALCSTCARAGSLIAPVISSLASVSQFLPFLIFGGLGSIAFLTSLTLPETGGQRLADSCEEIPQTSQPKPATTR